jgi:uncharacterized protein
MKKNKEFMTIIKDILSEKTIQNLQIYKHHYGSNRYEHCLSVAYYSYKICKFLRLDHVSAARAGLLHDFFLYDCENPETRPKNHIKNHPKVALENAQNLFILNDIEKDIILKHMWPITFSSPRYWETFIVTFIDKYCAIREWTNYCKYSAWSWYFSWFYI